jgi:branched-chain amino acid transport system ATP-binding protein
MSSTARLLRVEDLTVRFGGLTAVDDATFEVEAGTITGLIGPNGAGKTTCFNAINGLIPCRGRILLDGEDITATRPYIRARRGMSRTFQRLETFKTMTVRENVLVGAEMSRRRLQKLGVSPSRLADDLLRRVGLTGVADVSVELLPTGHQRLVELGRALASVPRLLLLDEPSSGLNDHETSGFGDLLRELAAEGLGILVVEHDMPFIMGTCSRINVLNFGQIISSGSPAQVRADEQVRSAYLGESSEDVKPNRAPARVVSVQPQESSETGPGLELRKVTAG